MLVGSFVPQTMVLAMDIVVEQLAMAASVDAATIQRRSGSWRASSFAVLEAAWVPAHAGFEVAAAW